MEESKEVEGFQQLLNARTQVGGTGGVLVSRLLLSASFRGGDLGTGCGSECPFQACRNGDCSLEEGRGAIPTHN